MRAMLVLLLLVGSGLAAWCLSLGRTSFSRNSEAQLDTFEAEFARLDAGGELDRTLAFTRGVLVKERRRRLLLPTGIAVATVALLGLVALVRRPPRRRRVDEEDSRLLTALGDPALALEGAKNKAAALLGVTRDAPAAVIEAALEAQLRERDPARYEGLAPSLLHIVAGEREALQKARDLLLRRDP